ncbi:MAG: NAD(P)H-hydrate dehydratase [Methanobacteriota archaeon]|nr:MAG: NAD(P)H-hydrate dehydratase [Euryarchaeota archaeon]
MISAIEMRILDRNAVYAGISTLDLMESAGKAVGEVAREEFSVRGKRVLVICGPGNNGGDGLVAARHLAEGGARVTVLIARSPDEFSTREAATNFERLGDVPVLAGVDRSEEAMGEADLIVDALLGIGAEGSLREPFASLVPRMNASGKPILSIDVPSGLGTDLAVRPTMTVALHDAKEGMTPENSGRIRIVDIGIPSKVTTMIGPGEFLLYPVPRVTSHKGQNGRVLVIAGGPYTGAPALVGFGALGVGADLVHIATPALAATVVASYSPMLIVHPLVGHRLLREDLRQIQEIVPRADAAAIGPGLGDVDGTMEAVREIVRNVRIPIVIDADAIKAVAADPKCLAGKTAVLTPHSREFQTLTGKSLPDSPEARGELVREAAKSFGATVLLKGPVDVVSDGARLKFNYTHNVGMTVGGTGDVLCGVTAGLIAKGMGPYDAARLAAFANGAAGNMAFEEKSYGLTSVDVAENLGRILAKYL